MAVRKKRKKSILLRLLVLGVSGYMIFNLITLYTTLSDRKKAYSVLQKTHETKQYEIEELGNLLKDGSQEKIIEKAARERLGYVFSDEVIYKAYQ